MTDSKPGQDGSQVPETIGALYSSANLHDTVYRDFSASRIDVRARFRYRILREEKEPVQTAQERTCEPRPRPDVTCVPEAPAFSASAPQDIKPSARPEDLSPRLKPQWLDPDPGQGLSDGSADSKDETLQRAKVRVASRWFALKDLFARSVPAAAERSGETKRERRVPVIAVFSFAGGVGKTSLIATLGRALASHGERILLADTTSFGLLPFYFGARDLKGGVVRTFTPPGNTIDAPVSVVALDAEQGQREGGGEDQLVEALFLEGQRSQRILVDVQTASEAVVRRLFPLMPMVLAPLLPEMNSVASVNAIESAFSGPVFSGTGGTAGQNIKPIYLLNQFDTSLPLHVDVREILQEQLGDRLLPFVVRQSPAVSEALAEGMTVLDYAPDSSAAEDYIRVANWFRSASAAAEDYRGVRWSER